MSGDSSTAYVDAHRDEFLDDLFALLEQPSISATGEVVADCTALAEALCEEYGFDATRTVPTAGHPAVVAHATADGAPDDRPTVLIYGHYDVQPVDLSTGRRRRSSRPSARVPTAATTSTPAAPATTKASGSLTSVRCGRRRVVDAGGRGAVR